MATPPMPLLSLAAGCVLDAQPPDVVTVASTAGFPAVGLWFDAERWTPAVTAETARRLADTGLIPLDIEVVRLGPGPLSEDTLRLLDAGMTLGAKHVLCIGTDPDHRALAERFAELCHRVADSGMTAVMEFMRFTTVRSLPEALSVVRMSDSPNAGVLVDALHLIRCDHSPSELAAAVATEPERFPYWQACDGPLQPPGAGDRDLVHEALDLRSCPGEGALPVAETAAALPSGVAWSLEIRSSEYRARYPEPVARASAIRAATDRFVRSGALTRPSGEADR